MALRSRGRGRSTVTEGPKVALGPALNGMIRVGEPNSFVHIIGDEHHRFSCPVPKCVRSHPAKLPASGHPAPKAVHREAESAGSHGQRAPHRNPLLSFRRTVSPGRLPRAGVRFTIPIYFFGYVAAFWPGTNWGRPAPRPGKYFSYTVSQGRSE